MTFSSDSRFYSLQTLLINKSLNNNYRSMIRNKQTHKHSEKIKYIWFCRCLVSLSFASRARLTIMKKWLTSSNSSSRIYLHLNKIKSLKLCFSIMKLQMVYANGCYMWSALLLYMLLYYFMESKRFIHKKNINGMTKTIKMLGVIILIMGIH